MNKAFDMMSKFKLQFGHGTEAVENNFYTIKDTMNITASIRPRH